MIAFWHWLVVAAIFAVIEVAVPVMVCIWFAAAAFGTAGIAWLAPDIAWEHQALIFAALAIAGVAIGRGNIQAINYFVATRYIDAIGRLAGTPNQKVILMPLESAAMIGSLAGIAEVARESFATPRAAPPPR